MICAISDFHHIRPRHEIPQDKILEWVALAHAKAEGVKQGAFSEEFHQDVKERLFRLGFGVDKIQSRGIHITDLYEKEWANMELYPVVLRPEGTGFREKSDFFERETTPIFEAFYPEQNPLPTHLIHVTCTGYVSPSPAQKLVSLRDAGKKTIVTHAYHMGCYAAIPAVRMGAGYLHLPSPTSASVDVVHTEMGSLHMHPLKHTTEQLVVQSLFADGFIKYTVNSSAVAPHFKVLALHEETIPNSLSSMTWRCEDQGLSMTIAKEVPILISRALEEYLDTLYEYAGVDKQNDTYFAVHPGGPRILQRVDELLKLEPFQLKYSHEVLRSYGNMSSATLPHIWQRILDDPEVKNGSHIISLAFGPGLLIAGGIFEKQDGRCTS
jgi:predicted naringenin-chalcone synthase